jgi:DNA-directed RNA polymerase specialized sigma24 family protein
MHTCPVLMRPAGHRGTATLAGPAEAGLAENVLAETFLAALHQRGGHDRSRPDARPRLYGIAIHRISRRRRAEVRSRQPEENGHG